MINLKEVQKADTRGAFFRCDKKKALDMLAHGQQPPVETVRYGQAGKMILAQGSEILHHVTPVESQSQRISMIFG